MIFDLLNNSSRYENLSPLINRGFSAACEYAGRPPGRYEVNGNDIFVLVQENETRSPADSIWETHREYIDIHCVLSGVETLGYVCDPSVLKITSPYDITIDAELSSGDGDFITAVPGTFVLFFPNEPHMPGVMTDNPAKLRKMVIKIKWLAG